MKAEIVIDLLLKEMIIIDSNNKWVIVTGAGSGIGFEVAKKFYDEGYNVIGLDKLITDNNYFFEIIECDVSNESSINDAFEKIKQKTQSINYLVNCAGIFLDKKRDYIEKLKFDEWNAVISNNLNGVFLTTRQCVPLLINAVGDKAIINISSDQSTHPKSKSSAYSVSKAGIDNFTMICAREFVDYKIRVNSINPASVRTSFIDKMVNSKKEKEEIFEKEDQKMPFGLIDSKSIANIAYFMCSDCCTNITGQSLLVDSGLYL